MRKAQKKKKTKSPSDGADGRTLVEDTTNQPLSTFSLTTCAMPVEHAIDIARISVFRELISVWFLKEENSPGV